MKRIDSPRNPLIRHLTKLVVDKDYRHMQNALIISGRKLIEEYNGMIKTLLTDDSSLLTKSIRSQNILLTTPRIIKKICGQKTPEGLIAEVPLPPPDSLKNTRYLLVLDRITDPGNMGALLRSALALDWEGVFILEGSADLFNDKSIRAAMGASLVLPYRVGSWKELKNLIEENSITPLVADVAGTSWQEIKKYKKVALILGNEAGGVRPRIKKYCQNIAIPLNPKQESLNVAAAGAILMYCLKNL